MTQPTAKREIALNSKITNIIVSTNQQIKELQEQIKPVMEQIRSKDDGLKNFVTGFSLHEDIDFTKENIGFNEDFTIMYVYDIPTEETTEVEPELKVLPKTKTTKLKK